MKATAKKQKNCAERIEPALELTLADVRKLWQAYLDGEEDVEDLGNIWEYGLNFDYIPAYTFVDQEQGYFRWQLSWGGTADEFRFYCDPGRHCYYVEYVFQDWFDSAELELTGEDKQLLLDWFLNMEEIGSVDAEYEKATESEE